MGFEAESLPPLHPSSQFRKKADDTAHDARELTNERARLFDGSANVQTTLSFFGGLGGRAEAGGLADFVEDGGADGAGSGGAV
jgi:hypothetical protein